MEWWEEQNGFFGSFYLNADTFRLEEQNEKEVKRRTRLEVTGVENYLKNKTNLKVLDCPCGYGRHSIELSKRGHLVTGIDLNTKHLELAKKNANDLPIRLVQKNMLDIEYSNKFDAVINLFASFGFFESETADFLLLRKFFQSLKNGGTCIVHIDIDMSRISQKSVLFENRIPLKNGSTLVINDEYNPINKRIMGEWSIIDVNKTKVTKNYSVRVYSLSELKNIFMAAGFKNPSIFGDWQGNEHSKESKNVIVVAEK